MTIVTEELTAIVVPFAALIAGGTAIFQAGVLRGRFDKHEQNVEKRVDMLEKNDRDRITRAEMDARLTGLGYQIRDVHELVSKLLTKLEKP